jgi:hypothetical protein
MSTRTSQRNDRSAAVNGSRRNQTRLQRRDGAGGILLGTTISFTSANTIADSGNGLALFNVGATIRIRGSARNSRTFDVVTSAAGSLTVRPAVVTTESAGPSITISREE